MLDDLPPRAGAAPETPQAAPPPARPQTAKPAAKSCATAEELARLVAARAPETLKHYLAAHAAKPAASLRR